MRRVLFLVISLALVECRDALPQIRAAGTPPTSNYDGRSTGPTGPTAPENLIEAVREIAGDYARGIKPEKIQAVLDVILVREGQELHGESKRWPVTVHLVSPRSASDTPLLRLAMTIGAGLTLGDIENIFGKHGPSIQARESIVEFQSPLGIPDFRVIASVLGDTRTSAPVLRIEMERPRP